MMDLSKFMPDLFGEGYSMTASALGGHQQDFAIVKINVSWSKTLSLTTMLIADLRAVKETVSHSKLFTSIKNLCSKWD